MSVPLQIRVTKPKYLKRYYEFNKGELLVAVLEYERKFLSGLAFIKIGNQQWKIRNTGFWTKYVELTAEQSPYSKLRFKIDWNYKFSFSLNSQQVYNFHSKGFWRRNWVWEDAEGRTLIEMKSNSLSKQNRGEISSILPETPEHYLLMVMGWYQVLTQEESSAAVIASTS